MRLEQRTTGFLSHWSHGVMIGALGNWVLAGGFVWWVLGARLDAADAGRAEPPWVTRWDGPVILIGLIALLATFISSAVAIEKPAGPDGNRA
jgi:hypothetical protein